MNSFVISDTHFYHENIIKYCSRPFENVNEMNASLIKRWNDTILSNDDIVYILGDFALIKSYDHVNDVNMLKILTNSLNGTKILIRGNHDWFSDDEYKEAGFSEIFSGFIEKNINKHLWVMSHYQMVSWRHSYRGTYHLFGHEHWTQENMPDHIIYEKMQWSERKYNVCADANNYTPINLNDLVKILDKRDINFLKKN